MPRTLCLNLSVVCRTVASNCVARYYSAESTCGATCTGWACGVYVYSSEVQLLLQALDQRGADVQFSELAVELHV